jgi:hypothetical protein
MPEESLIERLKAMTTQIRDYANDTIEKQLAGEGLSHPTIAAPARSLRERVVFYRTALE